MKSDPVEEFPPQPVGTLAPRTGQGPFVLRKWLVFPRPAPPCTDPAQAGLEPMADGAMWVDRRFRPALEAVGLASFEAVMESRQGHCLRALQPRENWRLELPVAGQPWGFYLKKHHVRPWHTRLRALLGDEPGETAGRVEARNIRRLTEAGIAVMDLVAYGERLHADGRLESFVLTEELHGFEQLDFFLPRRFVVPPLDRPSRRDHDLLRLIDDVAAVARRLHRAGYNHRDLYCCHFFLREPAAGRFEIRLIDLQRVQYRRWRRWRWIVKDLAQLAWSADRQRIKGTLRLAFLRRYLGVSKLRPADKRLIRAVLAKQRRMEKRLGIPT